jgi:hypothetical protein
VAVCKSCDVSSLPNLRNVPLTRSINKLARPIDIAPLHEIQRINPNTVFILAPVLPLAKIDDDSDFGELINRIVSNQRSLEQSLTDSGLHFINLSRAVPASMLLDYDHLAPEGRRIVRRLLSDLNL